uniref:Mediator complex subunit 30 n=1 Tax=Meloidogyne incognita TaxID=6306 RepID=A0A914MEM4_MELIC
MSNYQQQQIQSSSTTFPQYSQNIRQINSSQQSNQQQQQQSLLPIEQRINPLGLPPQMLINYDKHSIETLCTLGKELILELMTRMFSIISALKLNIKGEKSSKNDNNVDNVRLQLEYSRLIFMALTEIRLRIDLKLFKELKTGETLKTCRPSDKDLIELLSNPNPLEEDLQKLEMSKQFEKNRQKLLKINCEMKKLEWISINSDPSIFTIIGNESNEQKKMLNEERAKSRQS